VIVNGRGRLFGKEADYAAFEKVMTEALARTPTRVLGWCLMPNHWHLVVWPKEDGELSAFVRWLTHTHSQRWHAHRHSAGRGHVYQGRFKSFPIERDEHLLAIGSIESISLIRRTNWKRCVARWRVHPRLARRDGCSRRQRN
jgi:putative transposase